MSLILLGLFAAFAPTAQAGVVASPRLSGSLGTPGAAPVLIAPTSPLGSPLALLLPPALTATAYGTPLALYAPVVSPFAPMAVPMANPAAVLPAARAREDQPLDEAAAEASAFFDGGRAAAPGAGWTLGAFAGDGGASIRYKTREGTGGAPSRVYLGGLALAETFETLFARAEKPPGNELFFWPRGHSPSAWVATKVPFDADARDLASAINLAAKSSPGGKVELALHSYGALVFQRMLQLHPEPAVAAALRALAGSRVFLLQSTTHYEGSDRRLGPEAGRVAAATRMVIDWLNNGDATAETWRAAARLNPLLGPTVAVWLAQWNFSREQFIALAAKDFGAMMRADLSEPWDKPVDHIRKGFLKDLERNARDPGWQEALLRRANDTFQLEFTTKDAARIDQLGIRLEVVHADGDKLLGWENALILLERLGIEAPKKAPPAGTVLTDKTGRLRARIVSGDHYFPLKRREDLAGILKP